MRRQVTRKSFEHRHIALIGNCPTRPPHSTYSNIGVDLHSSRIPVTCNVTLHRTSAHSASSHRYFKHQQHRKILKHDSHLQLRFKLPIVNQDPALIMQATHHNLSLTGICDAIPTKKRLPTSPASEFTGSHTTQVAICPRAYTPTPNKVRQSPCSASPRHQPRFTRLPLHTGQAD